jgi:TolA-binding protein
MRSVLFQLTLSAFLASALSACSQSPVAWWQSINAKAQKLQSLEASHLALEAEHERLKRDYFRLENDYMELRAKVESTEAGNLNLKATGTLNGRTLASIAYEVPKGLRTDEELTLAYEHFTEHRFAEAAATFESFLSRPENAALVDATAMYTAGISWFQLGNYKKSREYLESARNSASGEQREKVHKKVDLWMRAIDRKLKQENSGAKALEMESGHGTLGG